MDKYESQVNKIMTYNSPLVLNEDFFWESPDYWGNRHKNSWGFWISSLEEKGIEDLDEHLISIGLNPVNIWVGSYVHGWIHRLLYKKGDDYNNITL